MCKYCEAALTHAHGARMPESALANDLMVFYAPSILYEKEVTMMELICASVCLTTMISFTLEKKYRGKEQRLFDQAVHMQRHTIGTRGNATSFPMPWEEILRMLQEVEDADDQIIAESLQHWQASRARSKIAQTPERLHKVHCNTCSCSESTSVWQGMGNL